MDSTVSYLLHFPYFYEHPKGFSQIKDNVFRVKLDTIDFNANKTLLCCSTSYLIFSCRGIFLSFIFFLFVAWYELPEQFYKANCGILISR